MHKETLMLQGVLKGDKFKIEIKGGIIPSIVSEGSPCIVEGSCVTEAIENVSSFLGEKSKEVEESLPYYDLINPNIATCLNRWTREGMTFFFWRSQSKHLLMLLVPSASVHFEVDSILEEILDLTMCVPDLGNCTGRREGLVSYDVTRVEEDALEVIALHDNLLVLDIGCIGSGTDLWSAFCGVFKLLRR